MTAQPASPVPPKRGRGRPRTTDTRITVGLPAGLLADLDAEAAARDLDRSEVIRQRLDRVRWQRRPAYLQ